MRIYEILNDIEYEELLKLIKGITVTKPRAIAIKRPVKKLPFEPKIAIPTPFFN